MLYKKWAAIALAIAIWSTCLLTPRASGTAVSSASAILVDTATGCVLYEKNAHEPRPMASTTKLMTALLAAELLDWDETVTVPAEAVLVEGSSLGLRGGDQLTAGDLVTGMLLASGNDAANAIALLAADSLSAFAAQMNGRAAAIGMTNSLFVTPSGLDEGDHHSTAYDMALLAAEVLKDDRLAAICATPQAYIHINGVKIAVTNNNKLLKLYADCIGMKTGFTKKSGRCLVSAAERDGAKLIAVTLNGGDYWNDHIALYEAGFAAMTPVTLSLPTLPELAVSGGTAAAVHLNAVSPTVTIPAAEAKKIETRIVCPPFVWAPVESGQRVGLVVWEYEGRTIAEVPLTVSNTVENRPVADTPERIGRLFMACLRALLSEP